MNAYHSDPDTKLAYVSEMLMHKEFDLQQRGGNVCAIGCTLGGLYDHNRYEDELGIPEVLAHLEDRIFETLPLDEARDWPVRFLEAIPVGADLSLVWPCFVLWLLTKELKHKSQATDQATALYRRRIHGDEPTSDQLLKARDTAVNERSWVELEAVRALEMAHAANSMASEAVTLAAVRATTFEEGREITRAMCRRMGEKLLELLAASWKR
jgi:hypothetical protein